MGSGLASSARWAVQIPQPPVPSPELSGLATPGGRSPQVLPYHCGADFQKSGSFPLEEKESYRLPGLRPAERQQGPVATIFPQRSCENLPGSVIY